MYNNYIQKFFYVEMLGKISYKFGKEEISILEKYINSEDKEIRKKTLSVCTNIMLSNETGDFETKYKLL